MPKSKAIRLFLPAAMTEALDNLVGAGRFSNRSEAIRFAIRELLKKEKVEMPIE